MTLSGISQICRLEADAWGELPALQNPVGEALGRGRFEPADVTVESYGNVLTAATFRDGLAAEDLRPRELELRDPDDELIVCVKAIKGQAPGQSPRPRRHLNASSERAHPSTRSPAAATPDRQPDRPST
jgi:hypothetical protein